MTQQRIREWYNHFNGNVYISFSGGKDSTVLTYLVHDMYPNVPLVFANTGLEYPEIQAFAREMGAEFVRPKMRFDEVISKYGYPIIGKEVAEAISFARRIVKNSEGGGDQRHFKRIELQGKRQSGKGRNWRIEEKTKVSGDQRQDRVEESQPHGQYPPPVWRENADESTDSDGNYFITLRPPTT